MMISRNVNDLISVPDVVFPFQMIDPSLGLSGGGPQSMAK